MSPSLAGRIAAALSVPRPAARVATAAILCAWVVQMGVLVARTFFHDQSASLAGELAAYGGGAQWKSVYFKGDKIGFMVTQSVPKDGGLELQEDGQLTMNLLGTQAAARLRTRALVDARFNLKSFRFSLDPGTGPMEVAGTVSGNTLSLSLTSASGTRTLTKELAAPPALSLNLARQLAASTLVVGKTYAFEVFDPATLRNQKMDVTVEARDVVSAAGRPIPVFRLASRFSGIESTSWVTQLGETVREESPTGLLVMKETRERALAPGVPGRGDLLETAAVVPQPSRRIDDPRTIDSLRLRVSGFDLASAALRGAGQEVHEDEVVIRRAAGPDGALRATAAGETEAAPTAAERAPEPLIESDAPEIVAAAAKAVGNASTDGDKTQRLVRFVASLLQKRPTVGIPSALEVLRTRVGDCNEHTALFVALARASGLAARVAIGIVYVHGAFYYHAWPEVFVRHEGEADGGAAGRGRFVPVDPTLDQYPADATHLRLVRGGLEQQAALLPALGKLRIGILDVQLQPGAQPILVGKGLQDAPAPAFLDLVLPGRDRASCWAQ
jgi:hypothetical protein